MIKHLNIEIKAKSDNNTFIKSLLKSKGADFKGIDHQLDTYFIVNNGKLKIREGQIEDYLVYYQRDNKKGPKQSNISLYKAEQGIKEILSDALGVLAVVDKKREIYFLENVKFHLDQVKGLGEFVEIEAISENGIKAKEELFKQCDYYLNFFKIKPEDLIDCSYSDLLKK